MNKKLLSCLLIASMILGASCSESDAERAKNTQMIGSEGPWYEMNYFSTSDYGKSEQYTQRDIVDCSSDSITIIENYVVGYDDIWTFDTPYEENNDIFNISKYSLDKDNYGELIGYYDIMSGDVLSFDIEDYYYKQVLDCFANGDDIDILLKEINPSSYDADYYIYKVNLNSGSLVSQKTIDLSMLGQQNLVMIYDILKTESGYSIATTDWDSIAIKINHFDNDFNFIDTETIDLRNQHNITYISDVVLIDSDYYFFSCSDIDDNSIGLLYETATDDMTEQSYIADSWYYYSFMSADRIYSADSYSVKRYNMLTGEEEIVVDFNNCNLDRSKINDINIAYADDEKMVSLGFSDHGYTVIELDKLESDPFAEKTALSVAQVGGYYSDAEFQAMYRYNINSDDTYIYVDTRYDIENLIDYDSEEDVNVQIRDASSQIGKQLLVDIIAGEGPDIILGGYEYSQLNNPNCCIDLNPYINSDSSFNRNDYFGAIFSSTTDELYQLPYAIGIDTLVGSDDAQAYCNGEYGMTLENFEAAVSDCNNGINPIQCVGSKEEYFIRMFNWNRDHFFEDGKVSIDRDYFEQIANHVASLSDISEDEFLQVSIDNPMDIRYNDIGVVSSLHNRNNILGLPSPDGTEPILTCCLSVGITTSCPNPDKAWNFVSTLFEDEFQKSLMFKMVKRDLRIEYETQELADYIYRAEINHELYHYTDQDINFKDDAVDSYIHALDSATQIYHSDSEIDIIIYEEIQAYFAGDKTVDEVINLIENRAQLVLDERG